MRERGKNRLLLLSLIAALPLSTFAEECENNLLTEVQQVEASVEKISNEFVLPGDFAVGFQRITEIKPNRDEAVALFQIMKQTKTSFETMKSVFSSIVKLYDTHLVSDIVHIIEVAIQNKIQPVQLAKALSNIQKDLLLVRSQLGFSENEDYMEYTEAKLQEAMVIFSIASQRKELNRETFRAEVDLIADELSLTKAIDVLMVLQVAQQSKQSVTDTVETLKEIQSLIYVSKRHIGFSQDMLNEEKIGPDIQAAITLMMITKQTTMDQKAIKEAFDQYKALAPKPSVDEFVQMLAQQVQQQMQKAMQAALQKKLAEQKQAEPGNEIPDSE